jgi:galactose mutarotase-like enzyme
VCEAKHFFHNSILITHLRFIFKVYMEHIENEILSLRARYQGAEMISLIDKRDGTELLWQADPQFWGWHAPMLFPVVGRCYQDLQMIGGRAFPMEKHGFARKSTFGLLEHEGYKMVFRLEQNEDTLKQWPFHFELLVRYRIQENRLYVGYELRNTGEQASYCALGGHPAFRLPWKEGERFEDYFLEFDPEEKLLRSMINEEGYFTGEQRIVSLQSGRIDLRSDDFREDAWIFKNLKSRKVTLGSYLNSRKLEMEFEDYPYLGIWTKAGAPYLCLEPWQGCADHALPVTDISMREGIVRLEPGMQMNRSFSLSVII